MAIIDSNAIPKFVRNTEAVYKAKASDYTSNGTIFWCTDIPVIYANGVRYAGVNANILAEIKAIKDITLNSATNELEITYWVDATNTNETKKIKLELATSSVDGLMSKEDKAKLDALSSKEDLDSTLNNITIESKNKSINVTPGTGSNKTNIEVNVDNSTIKVNGSGQLFVDPSATTISGKDAIKAEDKGTEGTEVSLTIANNEKILSQDGNGLKSTLTVVKKTTGLASNIKESYEVQGIDGVQIGETINIYKDSSLLSAKLLHATVDSKPSYSAGNWTDITDTSEANLALCFAYETKDGAIIVEAVPVGNFLRESEFGAGLQVVNGNVSVKKAEDSERFLVITEDGIAIKGLESAIGGALDSINAPEVGGTGKYVQSVKQENGQVVAVAQDLTASAVSVTPRTSNGWTGTDVQALLTEVMDVLTWNDR